MIFGMENKEKLGQEPIYPCEVIDTNSKICGKPTGYYNGYKTYMEIGMSKRFYAACAAMQGILSAMPHSKIEVYGDIEIKEGIVKKSFAIADELLKQENE